MQGFARQTVLDAVPIGTSLDFDGSSVPTGLLLCDGSAVSRTTYADLFAAIGTTYGPGDGSTTFNLPYELGPLPYPSYLINGEFTFAQRQTPTTYTTPLQTNSTTAADTTHDGYSADRWKCAFQTATLKYKRVDTDGSLESGITSRYYGQYQQQSSAGKFVVYQILEGTQTLPLAGRTITWQCKMKTSSAKTMRMAVLALGSGGTIDTLPTTIVSSSTWGANSTDPTWATNVSVVSSAASKSVTTSWTLFGVTVTAPTNAKNLIVAIWSDSQFAANDTLAITEAALYLTNGAVSIWMPRPIQQEFQVCQRFYEKSYDRDILPGTASFQNGYVAIQLGSNTILNSTTFGKVTFAVSKRATPVMTFYGIGGSAGQVSNGSGTDLGANTGTSVATGQSGSGVLQLSGGTVTTNTTEVLFQWTAESEI